MKFVRLLPLLLFSIGCESRLPTIDLVHDGTVIFRISEVGEILLAGNKRVIIPLKESEAIALQQITSRYSGRSVTILINEYRVGVVKLFPLQGVQELSFVVDDFQDFSEFIAREQIGIIYADSSGGEQKGLLDAFR